MATEALVQKVKQFIALAKSGDAEGALTGYKELFVSPEFATYPVDERRHAIKLVVNAKVPPNRPTPSAVSAHKAAMVPLAEILKGGEPEDYQLMGICYVFLGDEKKAAEHFRQGLTAERAKNPQSDLCGSLMKWVAAV